METYPAVKRLTSLISLKFTWQGLKPPKRASDWPEARLMALVIVSTKLLFGLDGVPRTPKHATEPAAVGLKWEALGGGTCGKVMRSAGASWEMAVQAGGMGARGAR